MSYKLKKRRTIKKKKIRGGVTQADINEFFEELKKPLGADSGYYSHSGNLSKKFFEMNPVVRHGMQIKREYHDAVREGNNDRTHTALYTACRFGTPEMIRIVLQVPGINVNRGNSREDSTPAIGVCYGPSDASEISLHSVLDVFKKLDDYSKDNNPRLDLTLANKGGETVWTTLHNKAAAGNLRFVY